MTDQLEKVWRDACAPEHHAAMKISVQSVWPQLANAIEEALREPQITMNTLQHVRRDAAVQALEKAAEGLLAAGQPYSAGILAEVVTRLKEKSK